METILERQAHEISENLEGLENRGTNLGTLLVHVGVTPVHISRLGGQLFASPPPIRHRPVECLPKSRAMMWFIEVVQFMHDDVVDQPDRKLEESPIEIEHPILAARTPMKTQIANLDARGRPSDQT